MHEQHPLYPLVVYARKIGKNTADLTAHDMANFMKWWMKIPSKLNTHKETYNMGRKIVSKPAAKVMNGTKAKFVKPMEEPQEELEVTELEEGEAVEMISDEDLEQVNNESNGEVTDEVVADIPLTQKQIDVLAWGIGTLLEEFDFSSEDMQETGEILQGLHDDLAPEATQS